MKKLALPAILLATLSCMTVNAQVKQTLKKVLELVIPREGGANAASVAWHPELKKYYASMAGNRDFFIGVFDTKGKCLNPPEQEAFFDVRGLWYNPATKTLQMNGYDQSGWAEYILDAKGFPTDVKVLYEGKYQPTEQSAGAFNPKQKVVYFFNDDGNVEKYDISNGSFLETMELTLGNTNEKGDADAEDNYDVLEEYNFTSIIYTGINGAEIGLLNFTNKEIELYNLKDGHLARKLILPDTAPAQQVLNFAFCNGTYWLFDNKARIWMGYR
jgi:hypothetical protein